MRISWLLSVAAGALAGAADAGELTIDNAAVRVVIVPEARKDVSVEVVSAGRADLPPLAMRRLADGGLTVEGAHAAAVEGCVHRHAGLRQGWGAPASPNPEFHARIHGVGEVSFADLPLITVRLPQHARVKASGAVLGTIEPAVSLTITSSACGDWALAGAAGKLAIDNVGGADVRAGASREASVRNSGDGDIRLGAVAGDLVAHNLGAGDLSVESVGGDIDADIAGRGDLSIRGGRHGKVRARLTGSGDIRLGAVTGGLVARNFGSGDLRADSVDGGLDVEVAGQGDVVVATGRHGAVRAQTAGRGDVRLGGVAQSLDAIVNGGGDVRVGVVEGQVSRRGAGRGDLVLGQRR